MGLFWLHVQGAAYIKCNFFNKITQTTAPCTKTASFKSIKVAEIEIYTLVDVESVIRVTIHKSDSKQNRVKSQSA